MKALRYWLLRLLAGKTAVILNANIRGGVRLDPDGESLIANCYISPAAGSGGGPLIGGDAQFV